MKSLKAAGALVSTLAGMFESRLELFSAEFNLERTRLAVLACLVMIGCGSLLLACLGLTICLVFAFGADNWLLTTLILSLVYLSLFALCAFFTYRQLDKRKLPFHATRQEIKEDITCLVSAIRNEKF